MKSAAFQQCGAKICSMRSTFPEVSWLQSSVTMEREDAIGSMGIITLSPAFYPNLWTRTQGQIIGTRVKIGYITRRTPYDKFHSYRRQSNLCVAAARGTASNILGPVHA